MGMVLLLLKNTKNLILNGLMMLLLKSENNFKNLIKMRHVIKCVVVKYDPKVNAVREDCVKMFNRLNWKKAEAWLNKMEQQKIPAYFYMNGMQKP
jgi:hypothetical protein